MLRIYSWILALFLSLLSACIEVDTRETADADNDQAETDDAIFYASLNRAIHQGQYDGTMELGELKKHGDMGVGSTERLAYELVIVDGTAYGIPADGKVYELPDTTKIPFAAVKTFQADQTIPINEPLMLSALENYLDSVRTKNAFAAIRINGTFSSIQYRSFNPQTKPYKPTDQVPDVPFDRSDIEATLVGFFTPESAEVLNSPVYHFHFVDKDRTTGGHVNDLRIRQGKIQIDYADQLRVELADPDVLQHIDLNKPIAD